MARAFRCSECGTGYSTTGNDVPPSPNWDDGHICTMIEVESKIPLFSPNRMNLKSQNEFKKKWEQQLGFTDKEKLEMERDARLRIIGQNGNTGEHYGEEE